MKKKLIRNKYADIIEQDENTKLSICPMGDRIEILTEKVKEECGELVDALLRTEFKDTIYFEDGRDEYDERQEEIIHNVSEELADLYTVLNQLNKLFDADIYKSYAEKLEEYGDFSNYIVIEEKL